MNINKDIKQATYFINKMKDRIPSIKSQLQLNKHVEMINAFIQLINIIEFLLDNKLQYNVIDKLLLVRIRNNVNAYYSENKPFGYWEIKHLVDRIDFDLSCSKNLLMKQVLDSLTSVDLAQHLNQIPTVPRKGTIFYDFDYTKITKEEIGKICEGIEDLPSEEEYEKKITNLLTEFKSQLQWH